MPYEVNNNYKKLPTRVNPKASVALRSDTIQKMLLRVLNDKQQAAQLTADLLGVISVNPALQDCEITSLISCALAARVCGLSIIPQLGQSYMIPFKCKEKDKKTGEEYYILKAQFQVGYKGYIQLCLRSGQYKKIGVKPVHEGEVQGLDELGDEIIKFDHKFDDEPVVGYFAYFQLVNGAVMPSYMTNDQCEKHGKKYSKSYGNLWTSNFEAMAMKTTLKLLLSRYGIMSTEIQNAIRYDQAVINTVEGKEVVDYVDNPNADESTGEIVEEEVSPEMLATADIREQIKAKKGGE